MFRKIFRKKLEKANRTDSVGFPASLFGLYWRVICVFPFYFWGLFMLRTLRQFVAMVSGSLISMWTFGLFENVATITNTSVSVTLLLIFSVAMSADFIYMLETFVFCKGIEPSNKYRHSMMYDRLLKNDVQYFVDNPSGQMIMQIQTVHGGSMALTVDFWSEIVGGIIGFLFVVGYIINLNIWMAVIVVGNGVLRVLWQMFVQKKVNVLKKEFQAVGAAFTGSRSDCFDNAVMVKLFAAEQAEDKYMLQQRKPLAGLFKRDGFLDRLRFVPTSLAWGVTNIVILLMCFVAIRDGSMTVADAAFVVTAASAITSAFSRLNNTLRTYSERKARAEQAFDDLFKEVLVQNKENAKKLKMSKAEIEFQDVTFAYVDKYVLKNFDLNIKSGERIGIVGLSGAGKTTLVNLLLRMYDVDKGAILIDGQNIKDVSQQSLRKQIALVPQESALFNRTILENIRYAQPTATRADVIAAAKKANIHKFISELPKGYDTLVGNRGIKLSGGQRQRIAIARAILKNAPVLILDEATSALDSENEMQIQSALRYVMRGKTTVAIAHRLSTLRNMDRIIVMHKGKIVERGSHKQLLRSDGAYRKLWDMQTGGIVGE